MKKKLLFVINTLGRAGAETAMIALLHQLDPELFDISLYVLCNQGELVQELPSHVKLLNHQYCDCSVLSSEGKKKLIKNIGKKCFYHNSLIKNIPYFIKNGMIMLRKNKQFLPEKLLWRIVSDGSDVLNGVYDLAIAYLEGGAAYFVHDHVQAKKKAAFIHVDYQKAGYTRAVDQDCYADFDRIFPVSDEVKEAFLAVYPECGQSIQVFHNLINKESILKKAAIPMEDSFHKGICLLTVGRLTYQKGYDCALKALKLLIERGFNIYWYVIGEGPEYKKLSDLAKALNLSDRFILMGAKSNPYPYYKAADIYVHALEDTKERLQLRLYRMFGVESTSHLKMSIACKPLGKGLAQQLQAFIEDYPDVRLIIIDTLQRIRDDGGDAYNYGKDYEIIQKIKAISDDRNICILMVHHTRKKQASNKFDMISGTNGLFGAADGAMILTVDERTKAEARMDVAGRDQQDQRIYLKREQQR